MQDDKLTVLLVGGHPADAFDNAGGTMAHHAAAGDRVVSAVMTHGVRSHAVQLIEHYRHGDASVEAKRVDGEVDQVVDEKRDEVREACSLMGIDEVHFLEYFDDILNRARGSDPPDRRSDPGGTTRYRHHPSSLGTGWGVEYSQPVCQHDALGMDAAAGMLRDSSCRPHKVGQVFFMGVMAACAPMDVLTAGQTVWCDVYVNIADVVERKIAALDLMRGQTYDGPYARKRVEAVDGHFGMFCGVAYAEPFTSMLPQVYDRLPITPHTRIKASEPNKEWHARVCKLLAAQVPVAGGR